LALVYVVALAFFTPPNDWDGLTYHVTRAALWDQEGGIGVVQAGNEPRLNGNPPLAEIGMYLSIGLGRTDRWLALPQLLGLLASAFGVVGLARRVGLSHPEAMFAALTFVTLPVVLLQGQSVMNDLVLTSFLLAATYFLLGRERHDGLLGALALALALSTKFTAALLLPLVVLVALAGSVGRRRLRTVGWAVVGILVSAPWYVLNLVDTGHLDGDLARLTGQQAEHSLAAIVTTLRALAIDTIDLSGADAENGIVFFIVGTAIGVAGATAGILRRDRRLTLSSLGAAVTVMVLPAAMAAVDGPLMRSYQKVWLLLGRDDIAYREPSNWVTATIADTSRSWYGPVGTLAVFGGLAIAIQAVRRGSMRPLALVLALAPAVAIAIFAVTIPWDPWRGRLLAYPIGLAIVVWGAAPRWRALEWTTVGLAVSTVALSLANPFTKPSGVAFVDPVGRSVWGRSWEDALTTVRDYDGTPEVLAAVRRLVPTDARLALAAPQDTFLSPFFGRGFSRHVDLLPEGARVPSHADWLVVHDTVDDVLFCPESWRMRTAAGNAWRVLERRAVDSCLT
jgi:hypothetical protein